MKMEKGSLLLLPLKAYTTASITDHTWLQTPAVEPLSRFSNIQKAVSLFQE